MEKSASSLLRRWTGKLLDRSFRFEILLLGLPGHMRIPAGWKGKQACLEEHLFYFVEEGSFSARIGKTGHRFKAGDFLWIPAGASFEFWLPAGGKLAIHRFRLRAGAPALRKAGPVILHDCGACRVWFEQIAAESGQRDPSGEIRFRGLLLCLFTELQRVLRDRAEPGAGLDRRQQGMLAEFAAREAAHWPGPADLAAHLNLSHDYFSRLFAKTFHKTPRRWLMEQRIGLAALRLRESALNVSQIADEFGYRDVFLFSRQFKAVTGLSPLRYRGRAV
jgi:AraC-like DNA-binding protein